MTLCNSPGQGLKKRNSIPVFQGQHIWQLWVARWTTTSFPSKLASKEHPNATEEIVAENVPEESSQSAAQLQR